MNDTAVLEAVKEIQQRKRAAGMAPDHVLRRELFNDVTESLKRLYTAGLIDGGETAADKWINPIE